MGCGGSSKVKETKDERAEGEVAVEEWNDYVTNLSPKVQTWAEDVAGDTTADKDKITGITNADVAQGSAGAERALTTGGMNPNSGRSITALGKASNRSAVVGSGAAVSAAEGVDNNRVSRLQQVVDIGMGKEVDAVDGMGAIAEQSVNQAMNDSVNKQMSDQANVNMGMSMAGAAAGAGMNYFDNQKPANPYISESNPRGLTAGQGL